MDHAKSSYIDITIPTRTNIIVVVVKPFFFKQISNNVKMYVTMFDFVYKEIHRQKDKKIAL